MDLGDALDPGLKQEISQQVRELRAKKLSQKGRKSAAGQDQAASQGLSKPQKEPSSQTAAVHSNPVAPHGQKEISKSRPLSAPVPGSIQGPQIKAIQTPPGQDQEPKSGPKIALNLPVKGVSDCL